MLIESGQTRVCCAVSVETKVPPFLEGTGQGWLTAEYGMLPGSGDRRIARPIAKQDGRTVEIQRRSGGPCGRWWPQPPGSDYAYD